MNRASDARDIAGYFALTSRIPQLDPARENELAQRWRRDGDRVAANELARAHLRQVVMMALKYRHYGVPVAELVAEGNLGIVLALAKFEPERGVRFASYAAYWIRAQMLGHVMKSWSAVAGGSGPLRSQLFFKLRRERVKVANQHGSGEAADEVLAERLGLPVDKLRAMLERLDKRDLSLDGLPGDEPRSLLDSLRATDDQEQELSGRQSDSDLKAMVEGIIVKLDARERYITEQRLMADPEEEQSLGQIARRMNISRERARQIEARTKRKLSVLIGSSASPAVKEWLSHEFGARLSA